MGDNDASDFEPDDTIWLEKVSSEHKEDLSWDDFDVEWSVPQIVPVAEARDLFPDFADLYELDDETRDRPVAFRAEFDISVELDVQTGVDPAEVVAGIRWSDLVHESVDDRHLAHSFADDWQESAVEL